MPVLLRNIILLVSVVSCILLLHLKRAEAGQVVLFDQGHGQRFLVEKGRALDLSNLADLFVEQGVVVKTTTGSLSENVLNTVDILIISGPFAPVIQPEINAVMKFLKQGGKLVVMAHIHQPFFQLFERLGVGISKGPILEQENIIGSSPKDFRVTQLNDHPITKNIESFNVYGSWGVINLVENVQAIARTSDRAWIDMDRNGRLNRQDAMQSFPIILTGKVGKGKFAVFGDDAIFQNGFLEGGNLQLAQNLVNWFCRQEVSV